MANHHIHLENGKGSIPFPGAKLGEWRVASRARDPEDKNLIRLVLESKQEPGRQQIRRVSGLPDIKLKFNMGDEQVLVNAEEIETHPANCNLDFGDIELIEPEIVEEEPKPEPAQEVEEPPDAEEPEKQGQEARLEADSEETEDLPTPVLLPEHVPTAVPEPSATLTVVGVDVNLHLDNHDESKGAEVLEAEPEKPEPLEVYAAPIKRLKPLPTPGPVTSLPHGNPPMRRTPAKPAKAMPTLHEQLRMKDERHRKKMERRAKRHAKKAHKARHKAQTKAQKRADKVARTQNAQNARANLPPKPRRQGPSPAFLALILVIAVGIAIVVVGIFGAIALFANGDGGHHEVTGAENTPPEDPDPPVSTPPPEDPDPPVSAPTPSEPEPTEEPEQTEPVNTPTEVAPGHIEIIVPAGNEWSVAVNTGEEYEIEYLFTGNKSGAEVMIGNGAYGPLDLDWREVNGPFKFRGEEGTKISIKWSPSS